MKFFENIFSKKNHQNSRKKFWARIFFIFSVAVNREPRQPRADLKSGRNLPELKDFSQKGHAPRPNFAPQKVQFKRPQIHHFSDHL